MNARWRIGLTWCGHDAPPIFYRRERNPSLSHRRLAYSVSR
jgi:hypothetical protein